MKVSEFHYLQASINLYNQDSEFGGILIDFTRRRWLISWWLLSKMCSKIHYLFISAWNRYEIWLQIIAKNILKVINKIEFNSSDINFNNIVQSLESRRLPSIIDACWIKWKYNNTAYSMWHTYFKCSDSYHSGSQWLTTVVLIIPVTTL